MADPVDDELVVSLARPGWNVTGTTFLGPELVAKRLQLLGEFVPQLVSRGCPLASTCIRRAHDDWNAEGDRARGPDNGHAASTCASGQPRGCRRCIRRDDHGARRGSQCFPSPMLFAEYGRIAGLAADNRLPTIYAAREGVDAGGLMSYGADLPDLSRKTALYVDKILKGAKPADLPVQQPTKFELVINLKTAKTLGIEVTPTLLAGADEVVE